MSDQEKTELSVVTRIAVVVGVHMIAASLASPKTMENPGFILPAMLAMPYGLISFVGLLVSWILPPKYSYTTIAFLARAVIFVLSFGIYLYLIPKTLLQKNTGQFIRWTLIFCIILLMSVIGCHHGIEQFSGGKAIF